MENTLALASGLVGQPLGQVSNKSNENAVDAAESVSIDKAPAMTDKIVNHICDTLNAKIPTIVSVVTDQIIENLHARMNSEQFTTDFINVLQTKLLQDKTYSEPFLAKFDNLFDIIIREAKNRHDKKELEQNTLLPPPPGPNGGGSHKKTNRKNQSAHKKTKRKRVRFL
jgi:hypothetical protein